MKEKKFTKKEYKKRKEDLAKAIKSLEEYQKIKPLDPKLEKELTEQLKSKFVNSKKK